MLEILTKEEIRAHAAHYEEGNPSVYCGTYRKYNEGSLYGMWIDLTSFDSYEEFIEFCCRLHRDEAEPELMFQDFENFPENWYCESCMSEAVFDKIKEYALLDNDRREAYEAYLDTFDGSLEDFEERYCGYWRYPEDFAEEMMRECYDIPKFLEFYIDYTAVWRDMSTGGEYMEVDGYIFRVS